MALERVFDCPRTLRRLRTGPLGKLLETFFLSYAQAMGQSALRTYKLSTVPRGLSEEQAQKIIDSVDCSTNTGRRDYAILQLLHT